MFAGLKSGRTSPTKDVVEPVVPEEQKVFKMNDINLQIPKGKLVAIVGSVGSGKSSLVQVSLRAFDLEETRADPCSSFVQGLIGEMKRVAGSVTFSDALSYAPQQAWIQNATIKVRYSSPSLTYVKARHG